MKKKENKTKILRNGCKLNKRVFLKMRNETYINVFLIECKGAYDFPICILFYYKLLI